MSRILSAWRNPDCLAVAALTLLWLLFFWRLLTPFADDQASLKRGDFSGQFAAFAGYQYQRLSQGEIPLWNPYNNGGLPFIADTQAAVFYPPRWMTIGISSLAGEWSYNALQIEMTLHVLLMSLLMYVLMRRMTLGQKQSPLAALTAAIIFAYGGYMSGYPPLQLAILEAGAWFPLGALGILEATRAKPLSWRFMSLAGFALGLSWLAGHPQTSWFLTYMLVAYLAYRVYHMRLGWRAFVAGGIILAMAAVGLCAVTLLPGLEYLFHTSRAGLDFSVKGNGFPIRDIAQMVYPGSVSLWSPLYVGIPALFFIALAVVHKAGDSRFWFVIAALGFALSLGANSPFYHLAYNLAPGLRFFRGQERAAFVVASSLAVVAGLGVSAAVTIPAHRHREGIIRGWNWFAALLLGIAVCVFILWVGEPRRWSGFFDIAVKSTIIAALSAFAIKGFVRQPGRVWIGCALLVIVAIDLFAENMGHHGTYDSRPYTEQLDMAPPPLARAVLRDDNHGQPFRVDGFRGLQDNYGSLYGLQDMRGISPLFLAGPERIIYRNYVQNPLAWELFAVKYVFSEADSLSVGSTVISSGSDRDGAVYLHKLDNPRPFVHLVYQADTVDSDEFAEAQMDDPRYDERDKIVLLDARPQLEMPNRAVDGMAEVILFRPEEIVIAVDSPENAILSISLPHYVGWEARLDGSPVEIWRAYGGLSAVETPAGRHRLSLRYAPMSYAVGAGLSALTWLTLGIVALFAWMRR